MKKRFLSYFCVLALCLGMLPTTALADAVVVVPPGGGDGDISVDVTPDNPGNVTVIVPGEDGGDVVVVIPPDEEEEPEPPAIGDVVNFAGHEWYIIGDENGGVKAPEGCYTLFAKNNDFGSTAFRTEENSGDRNNSTAFCYKDSDLYNRMNEIANGFSEAEKANIVPRKTLDDIMLKMTNDVVADQLLWPIGANEANTIDQSLRQFDAVYWGRSGDRGSEATDVFRTPEPSPGVATPTPTPTPTPTVTPTPEPYSTPKPRNNVFSVYAYNEDGSERVEATGGVLAGWNAEATNVFAIRPALYVKAEAVTGGVEASPVIGNTVSFAGHEWYIIGTGIGGVTAPEGCYTLFAKYDDFGSTAFRAGADDEDSTANHYKDSDLQNKMVEIANSSLSAYKDNIVARNTLDGISGDSPTGQLVWPISEAEWNSIDQRLRAFQTEYWTRTGWDGVIDGNFSNPGPINVYRVHSALADGSGLDGTKGIYTFPSIVTNSYAVRPALYVNAEAVGAPKVTESITGGEVYFGNQNWYIVGMGDTGLVPGPSKTVTLFADSIVEGQYAQTSINYSQGALCAAMKNLEGPLELSDQAQSLISSRTLTTTDEISGESVTTPFWPLSKSEFEAIQAENSSLLMGDAYPYWLRTEVPSEWGIHRTVYAGDTDGTLNQNNTPNSNFGVRPAFYLDLSTLFFAAGESSMGNSVNGNPVKLMPPGADSSQKRWNFVMYDKETLTLTMSAEQGQSGQSLTFQYNGTGGVYHSLAYVLEQDGVPVYYGNAASLIDSGSGTVTVPLLGSSSKLEDGDYTMRFYEEDRTDGIYFASDTVDLKISVADGTVSITNMGGVSVHTHNYGTELKYDENNHWRECACGAKTAVEAHTYDGDQDTECNVCKFKREISHVHQGVLIPGTPATCTQEGSKAYYTCTCQQNFEDEACTILIADLDSWKVIPKTGHTWSDSYLAANADAEKHYHVCTVCNVKDEGEAHTWNAESATEQNDKHCTICNYVAEAPTGHTHVGTLVLGQEPTCTQAGNKAYYTCTCQQNFEDETCTILIADLGSWRVIPATGHIWSDTYLAANADAEKHYHVCTVCNAKDEGEAHTWNAKAATETHDKHCIICGYVAEEQLEHTHTYGTEWKSDATYHWHECSCGEKADEAAHTYGESDTCTICGYVRPAAPEYTVTFNANGGSVSPSSAVTTDGKLTALPIPTRSGYDFVGWYTTASGGQPVSTGTEFTQDTTLYAHWNVREIVSGGGDPSTSGSTTPSQQAMDKIEAAKDGDTVEITLSTGNTKLDKEVFEELAGQDITLVVKLSGGVSWTVNGQDIPENATLTDLNMGVSMNTSTIPVNLINMVTGEKGAVQMTLAHDGEFGFAMTLTAPVGTENKGLWANLYHYDTISKQMLFEAAAQVDASGNVALKFSHASEYAIVLDTKSHELPFDDVNVGDWFQAAVEYVYRNGIMTGTSATTFEPGTTLSRAMVAQILYNLEGQPTVEGESTFSDTSTHWAAKAIAWAKQSGVVAGYEDNTFQPNKAVTREELAQMLYNYAKYKDYDLTASGDLTAFPDGEEVSSWAETAMAWANGNKLINGFEDDTLRPGGDCTRAQAASILMSFDLNLAN